MSTHKLLWISWNGIVKTNKDLLFQKSPIWIQVKLCVFCSYNSSWIRIIYFLICPRWFVYTLRRKIFSFPIRSYNLLRIIIVYKCYNHVTSIYQCFVNYMLQIYKDKNILIHNETIVHCLINCNSWSEL